MPRSSPARVAGVVAAAALVALAPPQAPPARVTYAVELVRATEDGGRWSLARGAVTGPQETALRLTLRTSAAEVEALFTLEPGAPPDTTVSLTGRFFTRRRVGTSRRGLSLWEQDEYQRAATLVWGGTARVHPFGPPEALGGRAGADSLWLEIAVRRAAAGAGTRPSESLTLADSSVDLTLEGVVRPRRAVVFLTLVRGDTASAPRPVDLVAEGATREVRLTVGGSAPGGPPGRTRGPRTRGGAMIAVAGSTRVLEVGLTRPEPPRTERERALALDADVVCLRVAEPAVASPTRTVCGRINNVARRLALGRGDTLVATFVWPGPR